MSSFNFHASGNILTKLLQWGRESRDELWCTNKKVIACILTHPKCSYTASWRRSIRHVVLWYSFWSRLLALLREEFRIPKLTFHSDLARHRAASRLALPCTSSFFLFKHRCRSDDGHQILTLVRLWPEFIKLVKNVGPKNLAAQEHQHLEYCAIWSCKLIIVYCDWSSTSTNGFIQKYHEGKPKFKFERQ